MSPVSSGEPARVDSAASRYVTACHIFPYPFVVTPLRPLFPPNSFFGYKLKFDERALIFGMIGNSFAAFKGSENKKLMTKEGQKFRKVEDVFNEFDIFTIAIFGPISYNIHIEISYI